MVISTACLNDSTSNSPLSFLNFIRLSEARLHAESSRYMYSLHGFEELMRDVPDEVCQLFTVVSYCIPGSPQSHAASAIWRSRSRARKVSITLPPRTAFVVHSLSSSAAFINSSVTRTEWFAFWYEIVSYAPRSEER